MPVLFILVIVVVVGVIAWGAYASAQRRQQLAAVAAQYGLRFGPERDWSVADRFPAFDCLRKGTNQYAYNTLTGPWGDREFFGFDYHYETHSTDAKGRRQTHHHAFSAVILSSPLPLQELAIRPETILDKVTEFFGWDDIDFESAEFSRKFHVSAPNKRWAYDVLHQRTMEFLLASPIFSLRFDRDHVLAFRDATFRPEEFAAAAAVVGGILDRLPEYVLQQQKGS